MWQVFIWELCNLLKVCSWSNHWGTNVMMGVVMGFHYPRYSCIPLTLGLFDQQWPGQFLRIPVHQPDEDAGPWGQGGHLHHSPAERQALWDVWQGLSFHSWPWGLGRSAGLGWSRVTNARELETKKKGDRNFDYHTTFEFAKTFPRKFSLLAAVLVVATLCAPLWPLKRLREDWWTSSKSWIHCMFTWLGLITRVQFFGLDCAK